VKKESCVSASYSAHAFFVHDVVCCYHAAFRERPRVDRPTKNVIGVGTAHERDLGGVFDLCMCEH
jgi:hypothetical protein